LHDRGRTEGEAIHTRLGRGYSTDWQKAQPEVVTVAASAFGQPLRDAQALLAEVARLRS